MKESKNQIKIKKLPFFIVMYFLLTIATIVFAVLCLFHSRLRFFERNATIFSIISATLLSAFCGLSVWFVVSRKEALAKSALSVYVFILFCLVVIFILQTTGFFEIVKDNEAFEKYLKKSGAWMPIVYILFQYLQVVLLPIPSVVSTLAGVALFGSWWTFLFSYIGIWLGSISAFLIGRKLGNKAVAWMVGEDTLKKWQSKLKGKDALVLTLMFFLPVFPDDVFCFISGLSSMKNRYFFIMITISRIISIGATCFSFTLIPFNTWWGLLIWGVIILAFVFVFLYVYKNLDKIQDWIAKKFKRKNKK